MRTLLAIALLAGCGGGSKSVGSSAPPPPGDGTRGLKNVSPDPVGAGTGSGSAQVASADPCEGGEQASNKPPVISDDFVTLGKLDSGKTSPASGGGTSGGYTADEINRVIRASAGTIKKCYQDALAAKPDLQGKVVAKFTIGPDGKVMKASASGIDPDVDTCVQRAISQLVFPAKGTTANVSYPFLFSSGG